MSCCKGSNSCSSATATVEMTETVEVRSAVKSAYGAEAKLMAEMTDDMRTSAAAVAEKFGYSKEEIESAPENSHAGLACGNPLAIASIREGETIVDIGSGGGFDCFLAARKVGPTGKVIGVDMTDDMLDLANKNKAKANGLYDHVEFRKGLAEKLPIEDGTVDCIISNCVLNLVPDENKPKAFEELFRILKPGGRVAIGDIILKGELPKDVQQSFEALIGCIAGAMTESRVRELLLAAGFDGIDVIDGQSDLNAYGLMYEDGSSEARGCCSAPPVEVAAPAAEPSTSFKKTALDTDKQEMVKILRSYNVNEFAFSGKIFAVRST